jgi:hypothetical protein
MIPTIYLIQGYTVAELMKNAVFLVRTDVLEELIASIIKAERNRKLGTTSAVFFNSLPLLTFIAR